MDSITLILYVSVSIIVVILVVYAVGYFKSFKRNKSSLVKTPKMRSKAILKDEENFGSAVVQGVEYVGSAMQRGYVMLLGQDGRIFKQHYWEDQIYPMNALQAIAGAERALWGVRSSRNKRSNDDEKIVEVEKKLSDMRKQEIVTKAETSIKVNEAATLPDQIAEIVDKVMKPPKEQIKVIGK